MTLSRYIPLPIRCMLWGRAAGHCEFCNKSLTFHPHTKETINLADVAHIIGFSVDGPRGEEDLSEELSSDITNLMLLCKECHRTVDTNKSNYPIELLRRMKEAHERRMAIVTAVDSAKHSHILLYGANVGEHASPISYQKGAYAMLPDWYPADTEVISLGMVNSSFRDRMAEFWAIEETHLKNMVAQQVRPRLANGTIRHLSVFGFAPQPLLVLLGFLLSDIPTAEVYQLHREPPDWKWQGHPSGFEYVIQEPSQFNASPALVLALSATITDERIRSILGDASIWRMTIAEPNNDFLKSRQQLQMFRENVRKLLDRIKACHGERALLHLFPAVPVSIAVDMGRVIMPKADLSLRIYDENKALGGFVRALDIDTGSTSEGRSQ